MGSLLSGVSVKEPATVEDCDSTWETDSEPELPEPAGEQRQEAGGDDPAREPPAPLPAARGLPEESQQDGEEAEGGRGEAAAAATAAEQNDDATEQTSKPKRSFYAARDLYKYRHQYPQNFKDLRYQNDLCNLRFYKNKIPFKPDGHPGNQCYAAPEGHPHWGPGHSHHWIRHAWIPPTAPDGTHIAIHALDHSMRCFVNCKGCHSVVLQALVEHKGHFMDICVGWLGQANGAQIFHNSGLCQRMEVGNYLPQQVLPVRDVTMPL